MTKNIAVARLLKQKKRHYWRIAALTSPLLLRMWQFPLEKQNYENYSVNRLYFFWFSKITSNNLLVYLEYLHPEVPGSLAFPHRQQSFPSHGGCLYSGLSPTKGPTAIRLSAVDLSNCSLTQRKKELCFANCPLFPLQTHSSAGNLWSVSVAYCMQILTLLSSLAFSEWGWKIQWILCTIMI